MELQTIRHQLSQLKLLTASREIEPIIKGYKKAVSLGWFSELLERELEERKARSLNTKVKAARFPAIKTWETFDFSFNPSLDESALTQLTYLDFIKHNQIIQFLGKTGTGKTHLATALGVQAARQGHRVYWSSAKRLQQLILESKLRNNLDALFKRILSAKLWILDDFGVVTYNREVAEEVFDLLDRRKYSSALILTSNRDISEWPTVFPDIVLANATIDRMFENSRTFIFDGPSHRLNGKISTSNIDNIKSKL